MNTRTTIWALAASAAGAMLIGGGVAFARKKPREVRPPYCEYIVSAGDTLTALGLRFFGDAKQWPALLSGQAKPFSAQDALPIGLVLRVPCLWHVVRGGDTLSSISGQYLRNPARWKRIYEANRAAIADPNKLEVGQLIAVPVSAATQEQAPADAKSNAPLDMVGAVACLG